MTPATCYSRVMPRSTNKIIKRLRWSRHIMGDLGLDWSLTQVSVSLSSSSSSWCRDTLTLVQSDITPEHQSSCLMRRCDTGGMKVHWTQWLLRSGWLSGAVLHGDNDNWSQCETWDTGIRSVVIMATRDGLFESLSAAADIQHGMCQESISAKRDLRNCNSQIFLHRVPDQ